MVRRTVFVAIAALTLMVTAACGSVFHSEGRRLFDRAAVDDGEARLGDAVMAFFVGPQNSEMYTVAGEKHEPGFVVLVAPDGSFRTVRTARMDMMRPVWSRDGLAFADEHTDFRLTETGMTRTASGKVTAQNLMFALPGGGTAGVYNVGDTDGGGYLNRVVITTEAGARGYDVQGDYFTGALCDDRVFGLTNIPGTHARQSSLGPNAQLLARLSPADGGEQVVGWRAHLGSGTPPGQVPCHDGIITFLSWDTDPDGTEHPRIVSWDTRTGDHRQHPLTFRDGTTLTLDDMGYAVQDWRNGRLEWYHADGRVFSTDPATGSTTTLFDTGRPTGAGRDTQTLTAFSGTALHTLSTTRDDDGTLTYTVFDRNGGHALRTVAVPIPHSSVGVSNLNLSYMAVRPS
ncbi:hypothetical protein [Catenuloplanes atrovinosus]|uniref:Uncharacterized protein n=1 Tax=Catenuloplanes atrovinosus TaxID=137266 RepID=A0AAE3YQ38_9ACTN|nr:hypothetical protein [Catenuloplanes atrovinosus]MDR7276363.1 hypothetical protein [Catenuloplanes atrovinosus]